MWITNALYDNFERLLGIVQQQSQRVFALLYKSGRNLDSPQHTRDQPIVKTVGSSGRFAVGGRHGRSLSQHFKGTDVAMAKFNEFVHELLHHAPYSLDLLPSDYFLFTNLKNGSTERDLASKLNHRSDNRQF